MEKIVDAFKQYATLEFRQETAQSLVDMGALFGDEEGLMRAKAEVFCQMIHRIVHEVPAVRYTAPLPDDLDPHQVELVVAAIDEAATNGVQLVLTHALECISNSKYDLCTSKLATRPNA
jgi:hypothetical protein